MKVLVAGGLGFIGTNFTLKLSHDHPDFQITVFDAMTYASHDPKTLRENGSIEVIKGDINNESLLQGIISDFELVINFAAETHNDNSLKNPNLFLESNVKGTYNLIQACVKHNIRYHHISTDEVFGDLPLDSNEKFTTETPYNPSSPYSSTKAASDLLVRAWVRSFGLRATISNCSNNYGPYQHEEKLIPRTILLAASGIKPKIYGTGANVRDWIHVDDHVNGIWGVIEKGRIGETYLLGANQERSNLQVVQAILRELKLPEDFFEFVPDRPGHDRRYAIDASKSRQELGWKPKHTSFEEGLKPVIAHYAQLAKSGRIDMSRISKSGLSTSV
jgi:dTDP-glucose 4,6-dehydratase